jgi:CheY-like chemotaxis protein
MNTEPSGLPVALEILLVEDNPHDAELTMRALKQSRLANQIHWVKDGAEALDLIFGRGGHAAPINHIPKLVLLDLKLPRVDGHEVLQRLKSDPRTRSIPVVVMTSSREEADLELAYQTGANSFIVKPVDFDKFGEAVRQLGFYWLLLNQIPAGLQTAAPPSPGTGA